MRLTEESAIEPEVREKLSLLFVRVSAQEQMQIASELGGFGFGVSCYRIENLADSLDVIQTHGCEVAFIDPSGLDFPAAEAIEILTVYLPVIVLARDISAREAVAYMRAGARDCLFSDELARVGPAVSLALRDSAGAAAPVGGYDDLADDEFFGLPEGLLDNDEPPELS